MRPTEIRQDRVRNRYVKATDAYFSGTAKGSFKYIGLEEYVEIPHEIKGVAVTSYKEMFQVSSVKGVKSTNSNVTNMEYMFGISQATTLNLSSFDTSKIVDPRNTLGMFDGSKATTGYARTQADADKFNNGITNKPIELTFIVKY